MPQGLRVKTPAGLSIKGEDEDLKRLRRVAGGAQVLGPVSRGRGAAPGTKSVTQLQAERLDADRATSAAGTAALKANLGSAQTGHAGWKTRLAREKMGSAERIAGQHTSADVDINAANALSRATSAEDVANIGAQSDLSIQGLRNVGATNIANTRTAGAERVQQLRSTSAEGIAAGREAGATSRQQALFSQQDKTAEDLATSSADLNRSKFAQDIALAGGTGAGSVDPFSGIDYTGVDIPTKPAKESLKYLPATTELLGPDGKRTSRPEGVVNLNTKEFQALRKKVDKDSPEYLETLRSANARNSYAYGN